MPTDICDIRFAGITAGTGNAQGVMSRGTQPSQWTFNTGYQLQYPAQIGNVTLWKNGEVIATFFDCATPGLAGSSGDVIEGNVIVLDRRWKWWNGGDEINGSYNVRHTDGSIKTGTEKTVRELLTLLLQQLGETGFDVSTVENVEPAPEVYWDYASPVEVLGALLSELALVLVLKLDNTIAIYPEGHVGAELPTENLMAESVTVDSIVQPDSLKLIGGQDLYELLFELEAVALQRDGKWKPIADVEYKPGGGWEPIDPAYGFDITFGDTDAIKEENQKLANSTVYRAYRVKRIGDGSLNLPGYGAITAPWQVLPLIPTLLEKIVDADGESRWKPPLIYTDAVDEVETGKNREFGTLYNGPFSIDAENGIVHFQEPLYRYLLNSGTQQVKPARTFLQCTVQVKDTTTRIPRRGTKELSLGNSNGTRTLTFRQENAYRTFITPFTIDPNAATITAGETTENTDDFNDVADYYLQAEREKIVPTQAKDRSYSTLQLINLDGRIAQVTYSMSGGVCTTRASLGTEHHQYVPSKSVRELFRVVTAGVKATNSAIAGTRNSGSPKSDAYSVGLNTLVVQHRGTSQ